MPTYQYVCTECAEPLEVVQKFSDDALTECPACGGRLRKVFSAAGIIFKGSGFYRTDSRGSSKASTPAASGSSNGSDSSAKTETAKKPADSSTTTPSTPKSSTTEKVA